MPTQKLTIRPTIIKLCMPQIEIHQYYIIFQTTQLPFSTMYYYYAYNLLPNTCGLLPTTILPPCTLPYLEPWSLPSIYQDSLLNAKPHRPTSLSLHSARSPPARSHPACPQKEKQKQQTTSQEDGSDAFTEKRNIIPNNINHILAYVQRRSKSEPVIARAIARLELTYPAPASTPFTTRRFYAYQTYLKGKIDIHVSKKTLRLVASNLDLHSDIFSPEEQLFYNRVCRAAIAHYLRNAAALTTLNSRRLRETSKKDHLRAQRHLLHFMKNIENQQILQA